MKPAISLVPEYLQMPEVRYVSVFWGSEGNWYGKTSNLRSLIHNVINKGEPTRITLTYMDDTEEDIKNERKTDR